MYTQCPECQTIFELDAATIAQAHGCVGCGQCGVTFDTMATLTDSAPAGPFEQLELNHPSPEPPVLMQRVDARIVDPDPAPASEPEIAGQTESIPDHPQPLAVAGQAEQPSPDGDQPTIQTESDGAASEPTHPDAGDAGAAEAESGEAIASIEEPAPAGDDGPWHARGDDLEATVPRDPALEQYLAPRDADDPPLSTLDRELAALDRAEQASQDTATDSAGGESIPPSFTRQRQRPMGSRMQRRLIAACAALAVLLLLQLGYAERASLVRTAIGGSLVRSVCGDLDCLGKFRDLDQISLLSRDVRKHPSVNNALIISATMHNAAEFTQPYPVVVITLSDLDDNRVAMRRFRPAEYLPDPELRHAGLAPDSSTALVFEVGDPGRDAVAFEFSFL